VIPGKLDTRALALLHRPQDRESLRRETEKLRRRGLTIGDISRTIGIAPAVVRDLLAGEP
jgi:hypothetical protein